MRHRIILIIPISMFWDVIYGNEGHIHLNPKHAHIVSLKHDIETDNLLILLEHPEFPASYEEHMYYKYRIHAMKNLFPYIFHDTNPLLYRKF